ncbi:MAG: iron ABC transporter permease [Gammaproteobacteria bacterium]|jgi:iron complex transport system permease protein|nr:iron ABC transporter permease [Gammaproteobacteria bacterium]MBT5204072.1 iron ABC transporter permease [Gammaproteobacteria bacterium]MBT5602858.1 iron ABC transporter permease [Gammaproteobacteria bacterium]MBT6246266.1 iron ABC transporter permease [Gammaproteobacteria bacterium]
MKSALFSALIMLIFFMLLALNLGESQLSFTSLLWQEDAVARMIMTEVRLPRVLLSVLVGAGVATSGALIQGLFRNPLADPALIGVSGGAALFASLYIVLGTGIGFYGFGLALSAFVGSLLATWLVLLIGDRGGRISGMLLAGIAVNAVSLSGVGILSLLATDQQLRSVTFWALGSFNHADWQSVLIALCMLPALLRILFLARRLDIMTLGDLEAGHLGIEVPRLRLEAILLAALITGIAVSLCGVIAFVGLIVPHLVRMASKARHEIVLPGSMIVGGMLVLLADTVSRQLFSPSQIPVGIVTALIGGPFFIYLIVKKDSGDRL